MLTNKAGWGCYETRENEGGGVDGKGEGGVGRAVSTEVTRREKRGVGDHGVVRQL